MQTVDVVPCKGGHAQERSLIAELLARVCPGELWMADRNFCTSPILFGIAERGVFFLIWQHGKPPFWEPRSEPRRAKRIETGVAVE